MKKQYKIVPQGHQPGARIGPHWFSNKQTVELDVDNLPERSPYRVALNKGELVEITSDKQKSSSSRTQSRSTQRQKSTSTKSESPAEKPEKSSPKSESVKSEEKKESSETKASSSNPETDSSE